MCERESQREGSPDTLASRDAIKLPGDDCLSDSDPEDPALPFDPEVEDLSSSSSDEDPGELGPARAAPRPEPAFSLRGGSSSFSTRSRSIFDCLEKAAGLGQERSTGLGQERSTGLGLERPTGQGLETPTGQGLERPTGLGLERPTGLGLERPTGLGQERPTGQGLEKAAGLGQERPTGPGQERPTGPGQERPTGLGLERPTLPCLKERLVGPPSQDKAPGLGLEAHLRDGVFARPSPPPPLVPRGGKSGRGGVPDYLVHPERWTRYSLEDVPETSDRQNATVAQRYIQSLRQNRDTAADERPEEPFLPAFNQGHNSSSQHKIVFSRPGRARTEEAGDEARDGARGRRTSLRHPDLEDEEEEEEEEGEALAHDPEEREGKRKRPQQEDDERAEPKEEKQQEKPNRFAAIKKINRKNLRKSTMTDED